MTTTNNKFGRYLEDKVDNESESRAPFSTKKDSPAFSAATGTKSVRISTQSYDQLMQLKRESGLSLVRLLDQAISLLYEQEKNHEQSK